MGKYFEFTCDTVGIDPEKFILILALLAILYS